MPTALITGVGGQDGSYLSELLAGKGGQGGRHGAGRRSVNIDRIRHLLAKIETRGMMEAEPEALRTK
jgi:GDP-D-mannose dehydratase